MQVGILNSGSSGNSTLFSTKTTNLLLDAGLSGIDTKRRLAKYDFPVEKLNGILVSHGHRDHVKGLGVLARRYNTPVYLNRITFNEISSIVGNLPETRFVKTGSDFTIGDIHIRTFPVQHDSSDPMGFIISNKKTKIAYITDLGKVTVEIQKRIRDMHLIIIESNHDLDMLINGPYPEYLKRRILGPKGHLSNIAAANALIDAVGPHTEEVILAHLSENNNEPKLVLSTVSEILEEENLGDINLEVASRYNAMNIIDI